MTASEKEALILENNLIKQYKPRYNIRLKDDKCYVSVKVTVKDPWPRVLVTRKLVKDGSAYLGPFHSASACATRSTSCGRSFRCGPAATPCSENRTRPCLEYQIKRCLGAVCAARSIAPTTQSICARRCCCSRASTELLDPLAGG